MHSREDGREHGRGVLFSVAITGRNPACVVWRVSVRKGEGYAVLHATGGVRKAKTQRFVLRGAERYSPISNQRRKRENYL